MRLFLFQYQIEYVGNLRNRKTKLLLFYLIIFFYNFRIYCEFDRRHMYNITYCPFIDVNVSLMYKF